MFSVLICSRSIAAVQRIANAAARHEQPHVIRTASSAREVLSQLGDSPADVLVIDAALAQPDGARFTRRVRAVHPGTAVILIGAANPQLTAAALAAGAHGVIVAGDAAGDLVAALVSGLLSTWPKPAESGIPAQRPAGAAAASAAVTHRELQVLRAMSEGHSNAEIGNLLFVSEDTVKTHARRLYRKLGARDRAHAVAAGFRTGLVS